LFCFRCFVFYCFPFCVFSFSTRRMVVFLCFVLWCGIFISVADSNVLNG
jgi:hypothetical protein